MPDLVDVLVTVAVAAVAIVPVLLAGRRALALPLLVMAAVVAMVVLGHADLALVIAAGTGLLLSVPQRNRLVAVYGGTVAVLLAGSELPETLTLPGDSTVVVVASMAAAALVGWLAAERLGGAAAWVLVALSAGAVYVAVPDTEQITVVATIAALGSLVLLIGGADGGARSRGRSPAPRTKRGIDGGVSNRSKATVAAPAPATVAVLAALVVWAAAWGAIGRPASFVAGPGCLATILVILVAAGRAPREDWRSRSGLVIAVAHLVVAVVMARTAGLEDSVSTAAAIAGAVLLVGGGVLATLVRRKAT